MMTSPRRTPVWTASLAGIAVLIAGCGSGSSGSMGTAGTSGGSGTAGTSGTTGTGGSGGTGAGGNSVAGTGGSTVSGAGGTSTTGTGGGGAAGTAGSGTAGATGTAGRGGTTGAGGAVGSGGRGGSAGATGRGGSAGGATGRGGTGGSAAGAGGGSGGSAAGGTTGAGGASPSSGCGMTAPASMRYSIDVSGMTREYILSVPSNYDPNHPYVLIFAWHPLGGSAQQTAGTGNSGYYGLKGSSNNQAILVSPEGLPFNGGTSLGWGNTNGQDIAFLRAMLDLFKSEMCVDQNRIFSTGFSFGGMMSNAVGCAGLARAIAPMAGNSQVSGCTNGTTPVAYMGFHGTHDSVVDISGGRTARDVFVKRNGCASTTTPMTPSWCDGIASSYQPCMCVTYDGCMAGYPVTWCEYNADHQAAPNSGPTLWSFFSQF